MTAALEVHGLRTSFGREGSAVAAVQGVSFAVERGQTLVLLGESGSGKSVTARSILRMYRGGATIEGQVLLHGEDISAVDEAAMRKVRGARIGLVPQDPTAALDPLRSVGGQLVETLRAHGIEKSRLQARTRAHRLLELVGIPDPLRVMKSRPHELSGGMRQRVVIAIAVSANPTVLIADEPTTALDVTVQSQVLALFGELQQRLNMALVLVTHDVGVAEQLGGSVGVMYAGRLVETGPVRDVLTSPQHPYTKGLLDSLPTPGTPRGQLRVIAGRPPLTGEAFSGCPFVARCPVSVAACSQRRPPLEEIGVGREAACLLVGALTSSEGFQA